MYAYKTAVQHHYGVLIVQDLASDLEDKQTLLQRLHTASQP